MKEQIIIKKQKDISIKEKMDICKIKSVFGDYSIESQLEWLDKNLEEDDLHFMLMDDVKLIAYLNLKNISINIDGKIHVAYGVGNVCSAISGKGYGSKLIKNLNDYLINKNIFGLLFCKNELTPFYEKANWIVLNENIVLLTFETNNIKTMVYPSIQISQKIEYLGKPF